MNTLQLIDSLKYIGTDQCEVTLDVGVCYNGGKSWMRAKTITDYGNINNHVGIKHVCGVYLQDLLVQITNSFNYQHGNLCILRFGEVLRGLDGEWTGTIKVGALILNALNGDVRYDEKRPHFNLLTGKELSLTDKPTKMKKYAQAQVDKNKHLSDINIMIGEYKGPLTAVTNIGQVELKRTALSEWVEVLWGLNAAFERIPAAVSTLAPTLSDIMDRPPNYQLKSQVFKVVGIHAPGDYSVGEFDQPWKDKLMDFLTIKDGSAFYVSGRIRASDGTMYYSPPATATCYLLMVADENGAACKSKGSYASLEDVNNVITWMVEFSQVTNLRGIMTDAEHVYPGCVP